MEISVPVYKNRVNFDWRDKYPDVETYLTSEYDPEFFDFDQYELSTDGGVDPCETKDDLEEYDERRRQREYMKCAQSFPYFCHKYVKIEHPVRGLQPFILYKFQRKAIEDFENYRFNIIKKFRQGGLTTAATIWAYWRSQFKTDEMYMFVSKTDSEAIAAGEKIKLAMEKMPSWMVPELSLSNKHQHYFAETGCKLYFNTVERARGRAMTYMFLDEAAFIPDMQKHWAAIFPTLSTGGNCVAISTVNGYGNWYQKTFEGAEKTRAGKKGGNNFHIIDLKYTQHPDYVLPGWAESMLAELGPRQYAQEIEGDFGGSGDTWIPAEMLTEYSRRVEETPPVLKKFEMWKNQPDPDKNLAPEDLESHALHVWKEPVAGQEYFIGVDGAEGIGASGDSSCFQVIDSDTCEQVAEFVSNTITALPLAQILDRVGKMYNEATIVVENERYGHTLLDRLQHTLYYANLFETVSGGSVKLGLKTNRGNRSAVLDGLRSRMLSGSLPIYSNRLLKELKTFVFNVNTHRVEAARGAHDDTIMAMATAIYGRDLTVRSAPADGTEGTGDLAERFAAETYEEIREELERDAADFWDTAEDDDVDDLLDLVGGGGESYDDFLRPHDSLLKEFGW